ncbi:MAG: chloride channel protein, partial [Thermohalobaculum sp.]
VAVGLAAAADGAGRVFAALLAWRPLAVSVVTPLGFALSRYLAGRYFPNAEGSGIPQAIAARQLQGTARREQLVSLRLAAGKILLVLIGLMCGASIGREGPTVQVGASVLFAIGRLSPRRQPGLILAGASAGVAAAFNTPLAGIVFGIEEMSRSLLRLRVVSWAAETRSIFRGHCHERSACDVGMGRNPRVHVSGRIQAVRAIHRRPSEKWRS